MNNEPSAEQGTFLGAYCAAQKNRLISDNVIFGFGVFVTMVLPVIAYCAIGGTVTPFSFATVGLLGTAIGLWKYNTPPLQRVSFAVRSLKPRKPLIPRLKPSPVVRAYN
jgi:hypothetical protein